MRSAGERDSYAKLHFPKVVVPDAFGVARPFVLTRGIQVFAIASAKVCR
jgi:hypothetical protein